MLAKCPFNSIDCPEAMDAVPKNQHAAPMPTGDTCTQARIKSLHSLLFLTTSTSQFENADLRHLSAAENHGATIFL